MNQPCEHLKNITEANFQPLREPIACEECLKEGTDLGFAAGMHAMRSRGLLRLVARQTRDEAFPQNTSSRDAFCYAGRAMDLVLRARGRRRTRASPCHN